VKTRLIVGGVLLALAIGAVVWWNATFVRVPAKVWIGPSGEARLRQFLAAERFAERMGLAAKELRSLPDVDALAPGGVLLMPGRRQLLDAQRMDRILAWVQNGGHLIAEAEAQGVADPLFDLLAVRRIDAPWITDPLAVTFADGAALKVALRSRLGLEPPTGRLLIRAASGESVRLASFGRGRGVVTVSASLDFARNFQIGDQDHAEFLWRLMQATPATHLAVYWHPQRLSLWGFLAENAAAVLAAGLALLVVWLWRIAPRFGPVAPDAPPARRRLLDHLRASGRYYWALNLRERLLIAARDAALRRVLRAQPEFAAASPPERAARLAALAGVPVGDAQRLLDAGGAIRGAAFIQVMQTAQRVHAALERGNR
jgi:hypothetical protein